MTNRLLSALVILLLLAGASCIPEGQIRPVNGRYVKLYEDKEYGSGWYWVDKDGNKHHVDRLPPKEDPFDPRNDPLDRYGSK